jgi:phenylalanyl-tRNA synthetase alpha chain
MFHQIDGLVVGEGITMADLKGTLTDFASQMFWPNIKTRFRCDYFPFVEPGVDFGISCYRCTDEPQPGCSVCHGTGWLEVLGAGMVHPKVLENVGYDPERYSGFAWGMGIERIAMIKHNIEDIRLFYANDLRFLEQFA